MPFDDNSFDFAICSLFTHHFANNGVIEIMREMKRVARRGIYVIDLHREKGAYRMYQLFCFVFRISRLVREDGLLSIKKSFQPDELSGLAKKAGFANVSSQTVFPARVVVTAT